LLLSLTDKSTHNVFTANSQACGIKNAKKFIQISQTNHLLCTSTVHPISELFGNYYFDYFIIYILYSRVDKYRSMHSAVKREDKIKQQKS